MANELQTGFGDIGSAVKDIFGGIGQLKAAGSYEEGASIARQSARETEWSTAIQQVKLDREIFKTVSGQAADVAGAGFTAGGSAGDLLRDSVSQGALAHQLTQVQGDINAEAYKAQAVALQGQADASKATATGDFIGGAINAIAGIAAFALLL